MKNAFVTGSTSGIGEAIAGRLAIENCNVIRNGRKPRQIDNYIEADLSKFSEVEKTVDVVGKICDGLDYLVLNVGATCRKKWDEITEEDWKYVMDVNVNMPFFLLQKLYPIMNQNGSVLLISSDMSIMPHATSVPYGVSKAAVNMLAKTMVKELEEKAIRINAVCPGFVDTKWQIEKPLDIRKNIEGKVALHRFAKPEEIADMCFSILKNTYMNGSVVSIDGGYDYR